MSLERGYMQASRTETGRLLAALAATRTGTIAECGTGCGVGAAWLRSGAPKTTRVITAELDPELAHGVMDMFARDDIDVMHADWSSLAEHAPFSLIFMDATSAKGWPRERIVGLLQEGGMIVLTISHHARHGHHSRVVGSTRYVWNGFPTNASPVWM
jgi:predicted O-methyltransferase YrrM